MRAEGERDRESGIASPRGHTISELHIVLKLNLFLKVPVELFLNLSRYLCIGVIRDFFRKPMFPNSKAPRLNQVRTAFKLVSKITITHTKPLSLSDYLLLWLVDIRSIETPLRDLDRREEMGAGILFEKDGKVLL